MSPRRPGRLAALEDRLFTAGRVRAYAGLVVVMSLALIAWRGAVGEWLVDQHGIIRSLDFTVYWVGGRVALAGDAVRAFDHADFTAAQAAVPIALGEDGGFHWVYPPTMFLYALPFAALPYLAAFAAWVGTTLAFFWATIDRIVRRPAAGLVALAPVPAMATLYLGHTGFFAAGLMAASLLLLESSPVAAGLVLGLLSYKPQLGLLFPIVLAAAGRWRTIAAAAAAAAILAAVSAALFGFDTWVAFARSLRETNPLTLMADDRVVSPLESVFGLAVQAGSGPDVAALIQGAVAAAVAAGVCLIWRGPTAAELKAAALTTGALIATPYLQVYDLVIIAVPAAFIVRHGLRVGFLPGERLAMLAGAVALDATLVLQAIGGPLIGPFILFGLLALVVRRVLRSTDTGRRDEAQSAA